MFTVSFVHTVPWLVILCLGLGGSRLGCKSTGKTDLADDKQAEEVPADFNLVFGQGGGFAGLWSGYTVQADGTVLTWQGQQAGDNAQPAGVLAPDQIATLWQYVLEEDFFEQDSQEVGNMTAFMEIRADSTEHRPTWIPHVEGIEEPDTPLEKLYVYCSRLVREAGEKQEPKD